MTPHEPYTHEFRLHHSSRKVNFVRKLAYLILRLVIKHVVSHHSELISWNEGNSTLEKIRGLECRIYEFFKLKIAN